MMSAWAADLPWLLTFVLGGLCVGSFLNVVIHRLPIMLERGWQADAAEVLGQLPPAAPRYDLMLPPSACPGCQRPIRAHENLPVLSWLWLRGRCAGCGQPISVRYPIVELMGGALALAAVWRFGIGVQALAACALLWTLLALAFIDADTMLLPDVITLPLLWGGLAVNLTPWGFAPLASAVLGAIAGYGSLWLVFWIFKLVRGKEGMGYGDFKLFAALGAWLGAPALLPLVILAATAGAVGGIAHMMIRRTREQQPLPFGPYLAVAGAFMLLGGARLLPAFPW